MVQFDKLRLSGFKSFVDPTELAIEAGLTGIVGPNGCGKSNLVEALKWVMGETSAKQMRGSEMEDVIFSGAGTRPARNIAEVMLTLDNKTRTAPAMVNDADQLDVARRIERGQGSAYTVNGREIRARDVQTLFADVPPPLPTSWCRSGRQFGFGHPARKALRHWPAGARRQPRGSVAARPRRHGPPHRS